MQVGVASVELDGAAVVLTVLALLLRGAHEAAQKVPWKQAHRQGPRDLPLRPPAHGGNLSREVSGADGSGSPLQPLTTGTGPERVSGDSAQPPRRRPEHRHRNRVAEPRVSQTEAVSHARAGDPPRNRSDTFQRLHTKTTAAVTYGRCPFYFSSLHPKDTTSIPAQSLKSPLTAAARGCGRRDAGAPWTSGRRGPADTAQRADVTARQRTARGCGGS